MVRKMSGAGVMPKKTETSATEHRIRDNYRPGLHTRPPRPRSAHSRIRNVGEAASRTWSKACEFTVQLLVDPHVVALGFWISLSYCGRQVPVHMLVADLDNGDRVAFDPLNERHF